MVTFGVGYFNFAAGYGYNGFAIRCVDVEGGAEYGSSEGSGLYDERMLRIVGYVKETFAFERYLAGGNGKVVGIGKLAAGVEHYGAAVGQFYELFIFKGKGRGLLLRYGRRLLHGLYEQPYRSGYGYNNRSCSGEPPDGARIGFGGVFSLRVGLL